jgi:hypothetical protein
MQVVTAETILELVARAAMTPRKRMNLNLHAALKDPINRFLNTGLTGFVFHAPAAELFLDWLEGAAPGTQCPRTADPVVR